MFVKTRPAPRRVRGDVCPNEEKATGYRLVAGDPGEQPIDVQSLEELAGLCQAAAAGGLELRARAVTRKGARPLTDAELLQLLQLLGGGR